MNKREAKRLACREAAQRLESDMDACETPPWLDDDDDEDRFDEAMLEIIAELHRRGVEPS